MTYKLPWSLRIYNARDHAADVIERIVLCNIRRRHHVKMGSYPRCYRCGRIVADNPMWPFAADTHPRDYKDAKLDEPLHIEMWHHGWWKKDE